MAVELPAYDEFPDVSVLEEIGPDLDGLAEHKEAVVLGAHYNLARRAAYGWPGTSNERWSTVAGDTYASYVEEDAAGDHTIHRFRFRTGPGKAGAWTLWGAVYADITGGGLGQAFVEVYEDDGVTLVGSIGFGVTGLGTTLDDLAGLDPDTWYQGLVILNPNTATTVRLYDWAIWLAEIAAAGDLP